jgi:hypothetical protein
LHLDGIKKHFHKFEIDEIEKSTILELITGGKKDSPETTNKTLNKFVGAIKAVTTFSFEREIKFPYLEKLKNRQNIK